MWPKIKKLLLQALNRVSHECIFACLEDSSLEESIQFAECNEIGIYSYLYGWMRFCFQFLYRLHLHIDLGT